MSDVDEFFAEKYESMNMPDESFGDYVARMAVVMNRYAIFTFPDTARLTRAFANRDIRLPQTARKAHASEPEEEDQARAPSSKRRKVNPSSSSTVPEGLSHEGSSM
jgi:hypothetical protein